MERTNYFKVKKIDVLKCILFFCFSGSTIVFGQILRQVANISPVRLMDYKILVTKQATSAIKKIDSTYANIELNKYDSLVKDYRYQNTLTMYRYEVPYEYKESEIVLSGLVIKPDSITTKKDIVYFHGTRPPWGILAIPSDFSEKNKPERMFYELKYLLMLADLGYTVFVPDYIGYGTSKKTEHPYTVVAPNVKAAYHAYSVLNERFNHLLKKNKDLISCGVSEGGAYALGLHEYMESLNLNTNVSSFPCEGPYDYGATLDWVFNNQPKSKFGILVYVWSAYSNLEHYYPNSSLKDSLFLIKNMSQKKVFKLKRFFGKNDSPYKYVNREFTTKLVNKEVEEFNVIVERNTVFYDWSPVGSIDFFHSGRDMLVPIINTENAYNYLKEKSNKVNYHYFENRGHKTLVDTYFGYLIEHLD